MKVITMGMDIGSTTSKCVVMKDGAEILGHGLVAAGIGTDGPGLAYQAALEHSGLRAADIDHALATGYGRTRWKEAEGEISELTAHALGCHFLLPQARTVIDIGGQDAKVIALDAQGVMSNFVMNDKCAAGTGRFLDVMSNLLKVDLDHLGALAQTAKGPVNISSTCTVFAESEVISQLANGAALEDVVAGICQSVAVRVAALARRVGLREVVCMSGGVSRNEGVRRALEQTLGTPVHTFPMAQLAGAVGAALHAAEKYA